MCQPAQQIVAIGWIVPKGLAQVKALQVRTHPSKLHIHDAFIHVRDAERSEVWVHLGVEDRRDGGSFEGATRRIAVHVHVRQLPKGSTPVEVGWK